MNISVPSIKLPKIAKVYYIVLCSLIIFILLWIFLSKFSYTNSSNYNHYLNIHSLEASKINSSDYNQLINISFRFNLLSVCGVKQPILLVLVHSAPENFEKRKAIRETWGQDQEGVKLLFMLGIANESEVEKTLEEENVQYKDFVQGNFIDTYHNLTYKHVMVLKYAVYHCPEAKFLLKVDDDVFVNMPNLKIFMKLFMAQNSERKKILCSRMCGNPVLREGRWGVEISEYPESMYPNHCSGFAILYPHDTIFALYSEAQKTKYFWIDDVHVSGTLAKKLCVTHIGLEELILSDDEVVEIVDSSFINNTKPFLFGRMNLDVHQIRILWDFVSKYTPKKVILDYLNY